MSLKIEIKRNGKFENFELSLSDVTLLNALEFIKENLDSTLTFKSSCKSGVCGSCSVVVNDEEVLACEYKLKNSDKIEALKNLNIIRDLVVNYENGLKTLKNRVFLESYKNIKVSSEDEHLYRKQSSCILCFSCYSSCPVYEFNPNFLAPFALSRIYRYIIDTRENSKKNKIDLIQKDGIWDCTLCGNCSLACPKGIDIKGDIFMLRNQSASYGYSDPNFSQFDSFGSSGISFSSF